MNFADALTQNVLLQNRNLSRLRLRYWKLKNTPYYNSMKAMKYCILELVAIALTEGHV